MRPGISSNSLWGYTAFLHRQESSPAIYRWGVVTSLRGSNVRRARSEYGQGSPHAATRGAGSHPERRTVLDHSPPRTEIPAEPADGTPVFPPPSGSARSDAPARPPDPDPAARSDPGQGRPLRTHSVSRPDPVPI